MAYGNPPLYTAEVVDATAVEQPISRQETKPDIIIAIDFGTTFTGIAYIPTALFGDSTWKIHEIAERISVLKRWPNARGAFAEKIPTALAYDATGRLRGWGSTITKGHKIKVEDFKLGLQQGAGFHYLTDDIDAATDVLGGFLANSEWRHPDLPHMTALDFAADYLNCVHHYFVHEYLPTQYGPEYLKGQHMGYVITLPAIWTEKAKDLTRQAAIRAGIDDSDLVFVSEPEAAALYCATICKDVDLGAGDKFLVCDAGGGTVDLISYKVISMEPFRVQECTVGTGGACGAAFLDKNYFDMLKRKLGDHADKILTPRLLETLKNDFDNGIKRNFDEDLEEEPEIEMGNAPDIPEIDLEDGLLKLTLADIKEVFRPIFQEILSYIKQQMSSVESLEPGNGVKTMFLVGGFGENTYLRKYLEKEIGALVDIKQPHAAQSAIVRGAVLHRMGVDIVKERMMRASYGIEKAVPFEFGRHPLSRLLVGPDGILRCSEVIHWYTKKNDMMPIGKVIRHTVYSQLTERKYKFASSLNCSLELLVCDEDNPPDYVEASIRSLCEIQVNLRDLPDEAFEQINGPEGVYYSITYDVAIIFAPVIEFRMLYKDKEYGKASATYT